MSSYADNQAKVKFSYKKYYSFRDKIGSKFSEKFRADMKIDFATKVLFYGDTQPAVVVSTAPLLIGAYSDEMDAVVMLRFPDEFAKQYKLTVGTRLTTSNVYFTERAIADDIHIGEKDSRQYTDFAPLVQLFFGKKDDKIMEKTKLFGEDVWQAVSEKANEYLRFYPNCSRDGFFCFK